MVASRGAAQRSARLHRSIPEGDRRGGTLASHPHRLSQRHKRPLRCHLNGRRKGGALAKLHHPLSRAHSRLLGFSPRSQNHSERPALEEVPLSEEANPAHLVADLRNGVATTVLVPHTWAKAQATRDLIPRIGLPVRGRTVLPQNAGTSHPWHQEAASLLHISHSQREVSLLSRSSHRSLTCNAWTQK